MNTRELHPKLHQAYRIIEIKSLNPCTKSLVFNATLDSEPGQFVMAWLPDINEKPFSILSDDPLSIMVSKAGLLNEAIHHLGVGDKVWLRGPFGRGYKLEGNSALLVSDREGAGPLFFLAREASKKGMTVAVCMGAPTMTDLMLVEEFAAAGACVRVFTEDGSRGIIGVVVQIVEEVIQTQQPDCIYAYGSNKLLNAIDDLGALHDIPRQLLWESRIRCGMGLCGACELRNARQGSGHPPGWLVCMDGPVSFEK